MWRLLCPCLQRPQFFLSPILTSLVGGEHLFLWVRSITHFLARQSSPDFLVMLAIVAPMVSNTGWCVLTSIVKLCASFALLQSIICIRGIISARIMASSMSWGGYYYVSSPCFSSMYAFILLCFIETIPAALSCKVNVVQFPKKLTSSCSSYWDLPVQGCTAKTLKKRRSLISSIKR